MKFQKVPKTDLDYVKLYAEELKKNPKFFKQQKELIDSQLIANSDLTKKRFSKKNFKTQIRNYLREIQVIS